MKYVQKNLMPNEKIIYTGHIHWIVYLFPVTVMLIGLCVLIGGAQDSLAAGLFMFLSGLFFSMCALIQRKTTELVVTSRRVISKVGFIQRSTMELNHNKVESFHVDQDILGRIFDYGTLIINGTGGGKTPIKMVADPLEFRKRAMIAIDVKQD